eukprot:1196143-Prorocentrum_minimum.AAC.1
MIGTLKAEARGRQSTDPPLRVALLCSLRSLFAFSPTPLGTLRRGRLPTPSPPTLKPSLKRPIEERRLAAHPRRPPYKVVVVRRR